MYSLARKYGAKAASLGSFALLAPAAFAQTAGNPITDVLDSISLAGITAAVLATMIVVVGIAVAFKGGDVGKRVVRKV